MEVCVEAAAFLLTILIGEKQRRLQAGLQNRDVLLCFTISYQFRKLMFMP